MQKLVIIGNIGRDAELKEVNSQLLIKFTVAVNNGYYNQQGTWVDRTNWYNCNIWKDKGAKTNVVTRLTKGRKIYVEGSPDISTYRANDGQTRIDLSMRVSNFELLDAASKDNAAQSEPAAPAATAPANSSTNSAQEQDDDLPF